MSNAHAHRHTAAGAVARHTYELPPHTHISGLLVQARSVELGHVADYYLRVSGALPEWPQERCAFTKRLTGDVVQYRNFKFGTETGVAMAEMLSELRQENAACRALEAAGETGLACADGSADKPFSKLRQNPPRLAILRACLQKSL